MHVFLFSSSDIKSTLFASSQIGPSSMTEFAISQQLLCEADDLYAAMAVLFQEAAGASTAQNTSPGSGPISSEGWLPGAREGSAATLRTVATNGTSDLLLKLEGWLKRCSKTAIADRFTTSGLALGEIALFSRLVVLLRANAESLDALPSLAQFHDRIAADPRVANVLDKFPAPPANASAAGWTQQSQLCRNDAVTAPIPPQQPSTLGIPIGESGRSDCALAAGNPSRRCLARRLSVVGDAFCDILVGPGLTRMPSWGGDTTVDRPILLCPGGSGLNTCVRFKKLGAIASGDATATTAFLYAPIGADHFGDVLRGACREAGVSVRPVVAALGSCDGDGEGGGGTATCIVLSGNGDRGFVSYNGLVGNFGAADIDVDELIKGSAHVHFAG